MSYLATYASPFEDKITKTKNDVNVLYSRSDPRGKNKTRRKFTNPKTRNITEIIQMLHEDMSDTEDNGLIRDTPKMAREGMMNFDDRDDVGADDFLRQTVNQGRDAHNYSQRAIMNDETARLKSEAEMAKRTYEIMKGQGGPPQVNVMQPSDSDYFSKNEMEFVSNVGGQLSSNEVQGDEKMYADARHTTVSNRPMMSATSTAEEIKRMTGQHSQQLVRGDVGDRYDYHKYDVNDDTYKSAHFTPRQQYNMQENDGFKYPKWATKKNRSLWRNKEIEPGICNEEEYAQCEKALGSQNTLMATQAELRHLMKKVDYMVHMFEENEETKNTFMLEELILYCFLGIFVLFIVDSFTNVNVKYKRNI